MPSLPSGPELVPGRKIPALLRAIRGELPLPHRATRLEDLKVRQIHIAARLRPLATGRARYSPDGKSIAFIRNSKDVEDIYVMPAAGGTPRRVTFDNRFVMGLAWTPDSREIVFSSDRGGANGGLWRIFASGGTPERLSVGSDNAYMPDHQPQGQPPSLRQRCLE